MIFPMEVLTHMKSQKIKEKDFVNEYKDKKF